jgi:energy-coupling factor transport system permease protein
MKLAAIDARVKLLLLALLSTLALTMKQPAALAALLVLTMVALLFGGVAPVKIWRQTRMILSLIGLLFLLQCLFDRGGEPLPIIGGLTIVTGGGLQAGLVVGLRLLIVVASALLALTGETRDYLLALRWLHLPWEVCYMVQAALRFIPLLRQEAQDTAAAQQMRGCDLKNASWRQRARLYITMLVPITVGALQRAEAMSISMEARAFRSRPGRTSWRRLQMKRDDWLYGLGFVFVLVIIFFVFK